MAACCEAEIGRSSALNFLRFRDSMSIEGLFVPICTSSIASSVAIVESWTGWDEDKGREESRVEDGR